MFNLMLPNPSASSSKALPVEVLGEETWANRMWVQAWQEVREWTWNVLSDALYLSNLLCLALLFCNVLYSCMVNLDQRCLFAMPPLCVVAPFCTLAFLLFCVIFASCGYRWCDFARTGVFSRQRSANKRRRFIAARILVKEEASAVGERDAMFDLAGYKRFSFLSLSHVGLFVASFETSCNAWLLETEALRAQAKVRAREELFLRIPQQVPNSQLIKSSQFLQAIKDAMPPQARLRAQSALVQEEWSVEIKHHQQLSAAGGVALAPRDAPPHGFCNKSDILVSPLVFSQ